MLSPSISGLPLAGPKTFNTAKAEPMPGGVRLTVTAKPPDDAKAVARLRGLGFIGLLTAGAHHGPHHLAMARGETFIHTH